MSDNVVSHPHRDLMAEAKREREIADSAEGQVLQQAICKAVNAYSEFLEREGVIWEIGVDPADHSARFCMRATNPSVGWA